jgi:endothelin-converting enzyme
MNPKLSHGPSSHSRPRFPKSILYHRRQQASLIDFNTCRNNNMAGNNRTERTPLLDGDAPAGDQADSTESTGTRFKRFLQRHGVLLVIILLLLLVLIPLIIQSVRDSSGKHDSHDHDEKPSDPPSNDTELCTSAACVLASANIIRSLAPE